MLIQENWVTIAFFISNGTMNNSVHHTVKYKINHTKQYIFQNKKQFNTKIIFLYQIYAKRTFTALFLTEFQGA